MCVERVDFALGLISRAVRPGVSSGAGLVEGQKGAYLSDCREIRRESGVRERRGALGSGAAGAASPAGQKPRPLSPGLKILLVFSNGFSCSFPAPACAAGWWRGGNSGARAGPARRSAAGRGLRSGFLLCSSIRRCKERDGTQASSPRPPLSSRYSEGSPGRALNPSLLTIHADTGSCEVPFASNPSKHSRSLR